MDIKNWSNSAGGNTSASPNGFPEGMAPSGVNDAARETMASVRRWYESAEWIDYGNTPTYVSAASFLVSAGQAATATYHIGRRIRALDGSNTIYGTIHSSTWTASAVYIYTTNDAGANFTASLSGIAVGVVSHVNTSIPDVTVSYAIRAGSASDALNAVFATSASSCTNAMFAQSASEVAGLSPGTMVICDTTPTAILWGLVDYSGTVAIGTGFTVGMSHAGVSTSYTYSVSFSRTFAATPVVIAVPSDIDINWPLGISSVTTTGFVYKSETPEKVSFQVIGQR